ncbi:glycine zipper 2TM domain-containing protein [Wolbachia endosymbiont of Folsomia candida]|uniref:hypothetical protein n=1 Tax=Wolbachia endosymbiont of Folsomia candida TaxID=169402 RepID=UPI000AEF1171|nr:hypothetical protein [Wolbachia endosymbiont of Folsomia candida]APR99078.1 hypothetical protein ASM33_07820 [Wolbachia endosymbiont of Folsomia candida]
MNFDQYLNLTNRILDLSKLNNIDTTQLVRFLQGNIDARHLKLKAGEAQKDLLQLKYILDVIAGILNGGGYASDYINFRNILLKANSGSKIVDKQDIDSLKKMVFWLAANDTYGGIIVNILRQSDKYPFLINLQDEQGHTLSHFYNHMPRINEILFEHGFIPRKKQEGNELQNILQDKQSVHLDLAVKKTNFITKNLINSIKANKNELKQAADSYEKRIPLLLKQYQDNPVMLKLLSISEQEKKSVMEETLNGKSVPGDKEFITEVAKKATQALIENYLTKDQDGKYCGGYTADSLQYDYKRDDAKVTIPESIGYVKLLIDRLSIPLEERKELLVTLAAQNSGLVEGKLHLIKSELESDDIFEEQKASDISPRKVSRTKFHNLIRSIADSNKIDGLFNQISGLNIERIWREQKEFVLMKQIYVAKTTYGGNGSACVQGSWSQIINSVSEIDSGLMDQCAKHLDKEIARKQEMAKQKDSITEENITVFVEDLARKLIQYAEDNPELKEALLDFSMNVVNVEKPEDITYEQQKILAKINQEFSQNIKKYLPNYGRNIPKIDEYKIIIAALPAVQIMQNFGQKFLRSQMTEEELNHTDDYESEGFQQEFLVEEVSTEPAIEQPQKFKSNRKYHVVGALAGIGLALGLGMAYYLEATLVVFIGAAVVGIVVGALLGALVDYGVGRLLDSPKCERQQQPKMQQPCIS